MYEKSFKQYNLFKNYVSSPDLKDDLSDDDVNEINNKLDEINKIINIKDYIRKD